MPSGLREAVAALSALPGGLLGPVDPDGMPSWTIRDAHCQQVVEFLAHYDFTDQENTALDQSMGIGPAMLGEAYENLLASFRSDKRNVTGAFYTPRIEIDLMCRLALVDWLGNHLGGGHQDLLYQTVFAADPLEQADADGALAERGLWPALRDLVQSAKVLDPACGSGSFLIGMLQVIEDLLVRADLQCDDGGTPFDVAVGSAMPCPHGIDSEPWAVAIARSRLWLQLTAGAAIGPAGTAAMAVWSDVCQRVRCGDSLVGDGVHGSRGSALHSTVAPTGGGQTFDLIVGNPPYVRHERMRGLGRYTPGGKAACAAESGELATYKARVERSTLSTWPRTFGHETGEAQPEWSLDGRNDLYVHFILKSLASLDVKGSLCFVTSNAWLNAAYGKDLQEFLLSRGQVKLVVENQACRSFSSARVNTVILLLGAALDAEEPCQQSLHNPIRFVSLFIPFEQALAPELWHRVATAAADWVCPRDTRRSRCRVVVRKQAQVLEDGTSSATRQYQGGKWGVAYLRAPEILQYIQAAHGDKLVRLQQVAQVRRGITSGANCFFFLGDEDTELWAIETEYLRPAIKSPRKLGQIWLEPADAGGSCVFMCHRPREALRGTAALEYIQYGESQGFHLRPTCRKRARWWDLGRRAGAGVHCNYLVDRVMRFFASDEPLLASDNFQQIYPAGYLESLVAACNCTLCQLSVNMLGRSNFGGGLLKVQTYELGSLLLPDPRLMGTEIQSLIRKAGLLDLDDPERHALDELVGDMLGLTRGEREAIDEELSSMVAMRLSKAQGPGHQPS
jgi:hypothetical protein